MNLQVGYSGSRVVHLAGREGTCTRSGLVWQVRPPCAISIRRRAWLAASRCYEPSKISTRVAPLVVTLSPKP